MKSDSVNCYPRTYIQRKSTITSASLQLHLIEEPWTLSGPPLARAERSGFSSDRRAPLLEGPLIV